MAARRLDFTRYIALGDSISIDLYPALDRLSELGTRRPSLGAASLLFSNHDELFPEFQRRDLASIIPDIVFRNLHDFASPSGYPTDNLTADGATTADVLARQIPKIEDSPDSVLVTITVGGNDMLSFLGDASSPYDLVRGIIERMQRILQEVRNRLPSSTILVGTVYDPSDGTHFLGGRRYDRESVWLHDYNDSVRRMGDLGNNIIIADIHGRFLGHGETVPERDRWFWRGSIFEPNSRGASEVRRLWLECLSM